MDEDAAFEEQIRRVTEESLRHYEQFELPRLLTQQNADQAGPSRRCDDAAVNSSNPRILPQGEFQETKPDKNAEPNDPAWEEAAFETAIQMHLDQAAAMDQPSTQAQMLSQTADGLDRTLTTLHRGEDAAGFHRDAGRTWVFPTDFPERRYQFDICRTALFHDTLVCLPTGLGKTFIAAVVMYNMYRWFPQGCVIFLAPTRPLVNQQVEACRNVAGLPAEHTAELTGSINPATRKQLWLERRVFFMTPQTLDNDLKTGSADAQRIRCVVLDEAHRARGGHAYCKLVRAIREKSRCFRLLALSATPGSTITAVKEVLQELRISRVEARAEDSPELAAYTHVRAIEAVVLPLGDELTVFKQRIFAVVDEFSRTLRQRRLVQASNLTKYGVLQASIAFRARGGPADNTVESEFACTLALCSAAELLCHHGLRSFYNNLTGMLSDPSKTRVSNRLRTSASLTALLADVKQRLGAEAVLQLNVSIGNSQAAAATAKDGTAYECTHPKMQRLIDIVVQHLQASQDRGESSRVMVFCQFRDVVTEIRHALEKHRPLVKPVHLIGQANSGALSRGQTQKEQREVLRKFSLGRTNVLIATCVGEEGLDIGEVDLIVCYEPHASPIRLVQRMGRTGRKRDGRVVMLITEGREQQKYQQSLSLGKTVLRQLLRSDLLKDSLCHDAPTMLPPGLVPTVIRMTMNARVTETKAVENKPAGSKATGSKAKGNQDLRVMLGKKTPKANVFASLEQMLSIGQPVDRLAPAEFLHALPNSAAGFREEPLEEVEWHVDLSRWIEWQRLEQDTTVARHSTLTGDLVALLQFSANRLQGPHSKDTALEMPVSTQRSPLKRLDTAADRLTKSNVTCVEPDTLRQRAAIPSTSQQGFLKQGPCQQSPSKQGPYPQGHSIAGPLKHGRIAPLDVPSSEDEDCRIMEPETVRSTNPKKDSSSKCSTTASKALLPWTKNHGDCDTCRALAGLLGSIVTETPAPQRPQLREVTLDPESFRGIFSARDLLTSSRNFVKFVAPHEPTDSPHEDPLAPETNAVTEPTSIPPSNKGTIRPTSTSPSKEMARLSTVAQNKATHMRAVAPQLSQNGTDACTTPRTDSRIEPIAANKVSGGTFIASRSEPTSVSFKQQTEEFDDSFLLTKPPAKCIGMRKETISDEAKRLRDAELLSELNLGSLSDLFDQWDDVDQSKHVPCKADQSNSALLKTDQLKNTSLKPDQSNSALLKTDQIKSTSLKADQSYSEAKEVSMYSVEQLLTKINAAPPSVSSFPPAEEPGSLLNRSVAPHSPVESLLPGSIRPRNVSKPESPLRESLHPQSFLLENSNSECRLPENLSPTKTSAPDDLRDLLSGFDDPLDDLLSGFNDPLKEPAFSDPINEPGLNDPLDDLLSGFNKPPAPVRPDPMQPVSKRPRLKLFEAESPDRPEPTGPQHSTPKPKNTWQFSRQCPTILSPVPQSPIAKKINATDTILRRQSPIGQISVGQSPVAQSHTAHNSTMLSPIGHVRFAHSPAQRLNKPHTSIEESPEAQRSVAGNDSSVQSSDLSRLAAPARPIRRLDSSNESAEVVDLAANESEVAGSSDEDFQSPPAEASSARRRAKRRLKERKQIAGRRRKCQFVDSEAESSGRDSSDGENSSGLDEYDASFVDDGSPGLGGGATQAQRAYIRSRLRSPSPLVPAPHPIATTLHDIGSYVEDSFVVQDVEDRDELTQLSPLSRAELELKRRKRRRQAGRPEVEGRGRPGKRRRIRSVSPDDSTEVILLDSSPESGTANKTAPANRKAEGSSVPAHDKTNEEVFSLILKDFDWSSAFPFEDLTTLDEPDEAGDPRKLDEPGKFPVPVAKKALFKKPICVQKDGGSKETPGNSQATEDKPLLVVVAGNGAPLVTREFRATPRVHVHSSDPGHAHFLASPRLPVVTATLQELSSCQPTLVGRLCRAVKSCRGTASWLVAEAAPAETGSAIWTHRAGRLRAQLARAGVRLLLSTGPADTARLIVKLAEMEAAAGQRNRL